jgi:hypothetical protein
LTLTWSWSLTATTTWTWSICSLTELSVLTHSV